MQVEALLFISIISLQIFDRIVAKVLHTSHKQNSYIVSTFHSFVVIACSAYYFLIENDEEVSRAGSIFSASYMLWDIPQLFITKYEPLLPLLIHHSFAGTFLSLSSSRETDFIDRTTTATCFYCVVKFQPRGLRYCSLLLLTEATVPVNSIKYYLESKGNTNSFHYLATRWALLITWTVARLYLFTFFFRWSFEEWTTLTFDMTLMFSIGPFLLLFNIAGLFKLVLVGFPWKVVQLQKKAK